MVGRPLPTGIQGWFSARMKRQRRRRRQIPAGSPLSPMVAAGLVFLSMLSSTMLIPALRPFFAAMHPGREGDLYLFSAVNMLGALFGAPLLGAWADATHKRSMLLVVAAVLDGALLFACSLPLPISFVLVFRMLQGAANVGALALLMSLTTPRGIPVAGGATIAAIAAGVPIGTLLLKGGPALPFQVGAMLPLVVAGVVGALQPGPAPDRRRAGSLWSAARFVAGPGIFVFAERFAIGLFIVPFSLLCHDVRGLSDAMVGRLYAAFLLPFALVTGLVPRVHLKPVVAVVVGVGAYAASLWGAARLEPVPLLAVVLAFGGCGAALVYAPSLRTAARVAPAQASAAMGALQGLGALGMFLGGALARGLAGLTVSLPRAEALRVPFDVAAASLVCLLFLGIVPFARAARLVSEDDDVDDGHDVDDEGGQGRRADETTASR